MRFRWLACIRLKFSGGPEDLAVGDEIVNDFLENPFARQGEEVREELSGGHFLAPVDLLFEFGSKFVKVLLREVKPLRGQRCGSVSEGTATFSTPGIHPSPSVRSTRSPGTCRKRLPVSAPFPS